MSHALPKRAFGARTEDPSRKPGPVRQHLRTLRTILRTRITPDSARFPDGSPRNFRGACILLFSALLCADAHADDAPKEFSPRVWLSPGIYSQHFDHSKDLRNDNWGLGVEVALAPDHALIGGNYINSNGGRTYYGVYEWRPLHWQLASLEVSAGILAGAFDGYPNYHDGGWFVAALPVLAVESRYLGVNLSVIPTLPHRLDGALSIQFKLRVW